MNNKVNRINTLKTVFNIDKQRPTAIEIHQWIEEKLKVRENQLQTLQLVGKQNAVYLKFVNCVTYEQYLNQYAGMPPLTLLNGNTTTVTI